MGSDEGKAQYGVRVMCECIHARWRNWDLRKVTVRGREKVRAVVNLYALTNNLLQGFRMLQECVGLSQAYLLLWQERPSAAA